jgi:hypothetical protein
MLGADPSDRRPSQAIMENCLHLRCPLRNLTPHLGVSLVLLLLVADCDILSPTLWATFSIVLGDAQRARPTSELKITVFRPKSAQMAPSYLASPGITPVSLCRQGSLEIRRHRSNILCRGCRLVLLHMIAHRTTGQFLLAKGQKDHFNGSYAFIHCISHKRLPQATPTSDYPAYDILQYEP